MSTSPRHEPRSPNDGQSGMPNGFIGAFAGGFTAGFAADFAADFGAALVVAPATGLRERCG